MSFNHCCNPCDEPKCVTDLDLDSSGKTLLVTYSDGQTEDIDLSSLLDWMVKDYRFKDAVEKLLKNPDTFLENMKSLLNSPDVSQIIDGDTIRVDSQGRLYVPDATTEQKGVVRLATSDEAIAGENATAAITPKTLKDVVDNALGNVQAPEVDANSILGNLTDCDEQPIAGGTAIATCENLFTALGNLDISQYVAQIPGNRLEVREEKLAVIDEAPPNLATQYVDYNAGDDSAEGTEEAPVKTVSEALNRINNGTRVGSYLLYLKVGQEHIVNQFLPGFTSATIRFGGYGDPTYGRTVDDTDTDYYPANADGYPRPSLKFDVYTREVGGQTLVGIPNLSAASVEVVGVDVDITGPDSTIPGWFNAPFNVSGILDILGSNIYLNNRHQLARCGSARLRNVNVNINDDAKLLDTVYGPTLLMLSPGYQAGEEKGQLSSRPNYTNAYWNNWSTITPENIGLNFVQVDGKYIPTDGGMSWTLED